MPKDSIVVVIKHLLIITFFICQKHLVVNQHYGNTLLQVGGLMFTGVKIKQVSQVSISASQKQHKQFDFLNHILVTSAQITQQIFKYVVVLKLFLSLTVFCCTPVSLLLPVLQHVNTR